MKCEMDTEKAKKVLELSHINEKREIRQNYRRLMRKYHPDVLGEYGPEQTQRVQELIEAYNLLIKQPEKAFHHIYRRDRWKWAGIINEKAFCDRNIYLFYTLETEEEPYYRTARGKYMWDPDEEDFRLFLISLRHASKTLLEQVEAKCGCYELDQEVKMLHFQTESKLFHLLAQQFVDPLSVLKKMNTPVTTDQKQREIYHFRAWIKAENQDPGNAMMKDLIKGGTLYPKKFQGYRILVENVEKQMLGHLSFDEDYLYFCVIPLLKQKCGQIKMKVRDIKSSRSWKKPEMKIDVDFYFRVENHICQNQSSELNEKIRTLLEKYRAELNQRE